MPLFPESEPWAVHHLAVGDGHTLHVEECAAVDGLPVVFLHGGPGSGCSPAQRRLFDPARYRVILFDQRGCGRSTPLGATEANTTAHLVADLERLRQYLGIPAWIVFGGSWGSTLGLAYAQTFPERVLGLVLRGIFLGSSDEIRAYVEGRSGGSAGSWQSFANTVPAGESADLLAACARRILAADPTIAVPAVRAWLNYERALMGEAPLNEVPDGARMAKARIQMHYLTQACFLPSDALLAGIDRIRHIPAAIVHGTADPVCPLSTAQELHRRWPEAHWLAVAGAGHAGLSPPIAEACSKALGWVAERVGDGRKGM